jgi:endonuclease III
MPPTHTTEGLRAAIELRERHPGLGVLVFSQYVETRYAADLLTDGAQGVGYLLKERVADVGDFLDALERLAGVGHKTASVVMAQAFGVPAFPIDTHIHRLAGRWQLSRARTVEETERDLKAVFPIERWNVLHLQIIYFGRQYCPARGHVPAHSPICSWAMSKARAQREARAQRRS